MNGVKGSGKGGMKKRRRSDDDSDDDDDDDGDDDGDALGGGTSGVGSDLRASQHAHPAPTSNLPNDMSSLFPNGTPSNANHHQHFNQPPQQTQNHSSLASHPFFGNYPYPGYPHHMPNVNPALGNPLGFYAPSAAAMAAAAAATGQFGYPGALPPHLLRAAAQQYAQESGGSNNSTPNSTGNMQQNNGSSTSGYTPIVRSPPQMDMSHQQQQGESTNYQQQNMSTSPRSGRKPALHLSFNNTAGHPTASQQAGPSRNSSMNENDSSMQQQYGHQHQSMDEATAAAAAAAQAAQEAATVSAYAEQAGLTIPGGGAGMHFPDSYLTSPSQLFPEIYRSMNAYAESQAHRAMTFGAENTPTGEDEDNEDGDGNGGGNGNARNVFRWPTMSSAAQANNTAAGGNSTTGQVQNGNSNANSTNTDTSHLTLNGEVKREGDSESEAIAS